MHLGLELQEETTVEDEGELNHEGTTHEKEGDDKTEAEVTPDEAAGEGGGDQADKKVADDEEHEETDVETEQMWKQQRKRKIETSQKKKLRTKCEFCQCKSKEINLLLQENRELRCELNKSKMDEDFLTQRRSGITGITGILYFAILMSLFYSVKDFLSVSKKLSPFQSTLPISLMFHVKLYPLPLLIP